MVIALIIVGGALWYSSVIVGQIQDEEREKVRVWSEAIKKKATFINITNNLFDRLREEERKKVELWAAATEKLANSEIGADITFLLQVVQGNESVPIILMDADSVPTSYRNLTIPADEIMVDVRKVHEWYNVPLPRTINDTIILNRDSAKAVLASDFPTIDFEAHAVNRKAAVQDSLRRYIVEWGGKYDPIEVEVFAGRMQRVFFNDSRIFTELQVKRDSLMASFTEELVDNSALVPVLFMDSSKTVVVATNLPDFNTDSLPLVQLTINQMLSHNEVIEVKLDETSTGYIYYEDSYVLKQLRYYPFIMFGIIGLFLLVSYFLFSTFRKAEQNQVWVGLAKETAHQLGTPLSSLMAWVEILKEKNIDSSTVQELNKDVERLETITDRFSKIGSETKLELQPLVPVINNVVSYLKPRISKKVEILVVATDDNIAALLNQPLFEWVLENLLKNAVDAMEGVGLITIEIEVQGKDVIIDVTDTGKGIPSGKHSTVFEPGFTTKQRGWGLGLSLTKRIVEQYHTGKIYVKRSEANKGTTFRIHLKK